MLAIEPRQKHRYKAKGGQLRLQSEPCSQPCTFRSLVQIRLAMQTDIQVLQQEPITDLLELAVLRFHKHQPVHREVESWLVQTSSIQYSFTLRSLMQLNTRRCCTCHSTLAAQQLFDQALHRALVHKFATQDDDKQPAHWKLLAVHKHCNATAEGRRSLLQLGSFLCSASPCNKIGQLCKPLCSASPTCYTTQQCQMLRQPRPKPAGSSD
ncbi:TPA: hypothetical protein ACH3X2_010145 [Trebouxia sp. C0005]